MPAEDSLLNALERFEGEATEAKAGFDERVEENLSQVSGKGQWKMKGRNAYFLYNVIAENIESKVGKVAEVKPRARVLPLVNGMGSAAEILEKITDYTWADCHMGSRLERVAHFGAQMGTGAMDVVYNPTLRFGNGDIDIPCRDPRSVLLDPAVKDASEVRHAEYVILKDIVPLDLARSEYYPRGAGLVAENRYSVYQKPDTTSYGRVKTALKHMQGKVGDLSPIAVPRTCLTTYWFQDRRKSSSDYSRYPLIDGVSEPAEKGVPFPGGRRIVVGQTATGPIVLEDSYNRYWDGEWPIELLSWNIDLESVWGGDDVQRQIKLQEAINRSGDAYVGNLLKNAIIRMLVDRGAMDPKELLKYANDGAEVIYKNPGREVTQQVPQPLPAEVLGLVNLLIDLSKRNIGVLDPQLQKQMPSIVTGPAIEGLQLAVEGSIRTAARRMEEFVERVGQKIISRIFQFWSSNRIVHFVGPTGEWKQFEFKRTQLLMMKDPESKFLRSRTPEEIQKAYRDFRFAVEPGSSLAITKAQRAMMKGEFFKMGGMRLSKVMEEVGIENAEEEMQKAKEERDKFGLQADQGDGRKKQSVLGV